MHAKDSQMSSAHAEADRGGSVKANDPTRDPDVVHLIGIGEPE